MDEHINEKVRLARENAPIQEAWFDVLSQEKHQRAAGARQFQGKDQSLRGLGAGFGRSYGESQAFFGAMQRSAGMTGMLDIGGGGGSAWKNKKALGVQDEDAVTVIRGPGGRPATLADRVLGTYESMSIGVNASKAALRGMDMPDGDLDIKRRSTARTMGRGRAAMELARRGIGDAAAMSSVDSAFSAFGGQAADGQKAFVALEHAMARGIQGGFKDPRTREELVDAIGQGASTIIAAGGTKTFDSLAQVLAGGGTMGKEGSVREIQSRRQALDINANLSRDNRFFIQQNVANANEILGFGQGSSLQRQYMANASNTDLLSDTSTAKELGISNTDRMRMVQSRLKTQIANAVRQDPGMLAQLTSGQDPIDVILRNKGKAAAALVAGDASIGGNEATAQGLVAALASVTKALQGNKEVSDRDMAEARSAAGSIANTAISIEEQAKMKIWASATKEMMNDFIKKFDPNTIIETIKEQQKKMENVKINTDDILMVKVMSKMPPDKGPVGR